MTRHRPCVVCGRGDWCGYSADGGVAICMRVKSDHPTNNGGWLHRLADSASRPVPRLHAPPPRAPAPCTTDWVALLRRFERDTRTADVERLAAGLGVSPGSLSRLGIVWAAPHRAWGFPMHDSERQIVGVRLRAESGRKWCITGGHNGLFWPEDLTSSGPLLICEGLTDVAAMLDLGYASIGRPSCAGATEVVVEVVQRLRREDVVIVADADGPGIEGADRLAQALTEAGHHPKVICPLQGKDARGWLRAGASHAIVDAVIASAQYWRASGG